MGCRSLDQALQSLSKTRGERVSDDEWQHVADPASDGYDLFGGQDVHFRNLESAGDEEPKGSADSDESADEDEAFDLQSSGEESGSGEDHEEDELNMDVAGRAIAGLVAQAGRRNLRVFRHKVSGIYHLMAGDQAPDVDGEMSSTKCGKLISHNFVETEPNESFLPAKCKRCFTQ